MIAYKKRTRINREITVPQVRLIDAEGEQIGIVPIQEAQRQAQEAGLDLAEIAPNAEPPVCRIMDYKKSVFEEKKKRNKNTKKQKQTQLKQIRFTSRTDIGDYQVKLRSIIRFLEDGDKVKVSLRFRGREMAHQDLGRNLLERLEQDLVEYGSVEQHPKMEGRQMIMVLFPLKKQPQ